MAYTPPPAPQPYLPNVSWVKPPVASRSDLQAVASSPEDQQLQVAAENAPLRVLYGRPRVGAHIADVLVYQSKLIVFAVWGHGEIDSVESYTINDETPPAGVTATHYTGTLGQTVNSTLVAAYTANGVSFSDAMPGIAYSVFSFTAGAVDGFPAIAAIIRGRKVYDPRTGLTVWSDCPSLCLADFIQSVDYGLGRTVDWASVTAAANANDELVGGEKRRLMNLAIDQVSETRQWCEALRTYAGCFIQYNKADVTLVPDRPSSSVATFTNANIVAGTMRIAKRGVQQVPTVIDVRYTDTSKLPWTEKSAIAKAAGVDAGTTPRRESQISLPGINRYSQAYREAVERLNKLQLSDMSCQFVVFDEGVKLQDGDVVTVSHRYGLSSKLVRIFNPVSNTPGRWALSATEYDPAFYSDEVQAEPTFADTALPSPSSPPALSYLYAWEDVFQLDNGTWSSRIKAFWIQPDYAYIAEYRVEVYQGGLLVHTGSARPGTAFYATPAVKEGLEYVVKAAVVTTIGTVGEWAQYNITPQGKYLAPGNVPSAKTFEVGGKVYMSWDAAIDIDIWRYEVRYGPTAGTWETATMIDRVDALRLETSEIPAGTWRFYVKALDSVGQYSITAAYSDVTVTSDARAFFVNAYEQTTPTLTNMASYTLGPTDPNVYYITEDGAAWESKFTNGLDTYTNPLATYHANVTSTWLGEATDDFGQILSGQWTGTATVEALNGSLISYLGLTDGSGEGATWTYTAGLSQKATGRSARLKHEALTSSTMLVTVPLQRIRLDAIPREEVGSDTSSATLPTTIQLDNVYTAVKTISITPAGAGVARIGVYDNIVLGDPSSFDVYLFDAAGTQVAGGFYYSFKGV